MRAVVALGIALACLGACARPATEVPARPPSTLPAGAPAPGAPATPWKAKTRAERIEFMGLHFFPEMKALFQGHDPRGYARFRCQTCHGEDMEAVSFKMPNGLYPLPPGEPLAAAVADDEKTARFMADEVEPAVTRLLGEDVAKEPSCHLCHGTE